VDNPHFPDLSFTGGKRPTIEYRYTGAQGPSASTAVLHKELSSQRLAAVVPGASVDDHKQWLAGLLRLIDAVRLVAAIVLGLVVLAAVATVVFVTRTGLDVHRRVIDIVHLVGATDGYIAGQFQANALTLGLLGGIGGLALAGLTLVVVAALLSGIDENLLPPLSLAPGQWILLAALPLIAALLAMLTARWTVLGSLRRTL